MCIVFGESNNWKPCCNHGECPEKSLWSEKAYVERKTKTPTVTLSSCENGLRVRLLGSSWSWCLPGTCEDFFWFPHYLWPLTLPLHRQWAPGLNELVRGPHPLHYCVSWSLCHFSEFSLSQTSSEERTLAPYRKNHNSLSKKATFLGLKFYPNLKTVFSAFKKLIEKHRMPVLYAKVSEMYGKQHHKRGYQMTTDFEMYSTLYSTVHYKENHSKTVVWIT